MPPLSTALVSPTFRFSYQLRSLPFFSKSSLIYHIFFFFIRIKKSILFSAYPSKWHYLMKQIKLATTTTTTTATQSQNVPVKMRFLRFLEKERKEERKNKTKLFSSLISYFLPLGCTKPSPSHFLLLSLNLCLQNKTKICPIINMAILSLVWLGRAMSTFRPKRKPNYFYVNIHLILCQENKKTKWRVMLIKTRLLFFLGKSQLNFYFFLFLAYFSFFFFVSFSNA